MGMPANRCAMCMKPIDGAPLRYRGANACLKCFEREAGGVIAGERPSDLPLPPPPPDPSTVLVATLPGIPGRRVIRSVDVITAECAFGMNVIRDWFAAWTDVVGGRSRATQNVLRNARETCLRELKLEALRVGANAVVGIDLDYSEFSGGGKSMLFLAASGTAVVLEPESSASME